MTQTWKNINELHF